MKFSHLRILNIRNHKKTIIEFNPGINILWGDNGAGKTSILESLSICGFSKSFVNSKDLTLMNHLADNYLIEAKLFNDYEIPYKIKIFYEPHKKKVISSTYGDNLLPKDIIGKIPMIILAPDMKNITNGPPEYRRQFVDRILSQESYEYFENLMNYKKALKQRNAILFKLKNSNLLDLTQYNTWTKIFINLAEKIIIKRAKFINDFNLFFKETYNKIFKENEKVELIYKPDFITLKNDNFSGQLNMIAKNLEKDEIIRATSLFGPHKDDFLIKINDGIAKDVASQGQHKSLLIALKFAEFQYLKTNKQETPVIILDDIFSELDEERISNVFSMTCEYKAQTFISTTDPKRIKNFFNNGTNVSYYQIKNGAIVDKKK